MSRSLSLENPTIYPHDGFVVAIDGPAAAGKGTIGKLLASELEFAHLDTGKIYRALALASHRANIEPTDIDGIIKIARSLTYDDFSNLANLSGLAGMLAAKYAPQRHVRDIAVALQRRISQDQLLKHSGIVVDGRDIGTVVFPHAPVKLFVTASPEIRAARRHAELSARGETVAFDSLLDEINRRDHQDATRQEAPLVAAADAHLLDTSEMSIEAAFREALALVERARGS